MPVAAQIGREFGHHHEVALAGRDGSLAPGTPVALAGRIWLYDGDDVYPESTAHSTRATVMSPVLTTITMSRESRRCGRKGLKPMRAWYRSTRRR